MEKINTAEIQEGDIVHFRNGGKSEVVLQPYGFITNYPAHLSIGNIEMKNWIQAGKYIGRADFPCWNTGFDIVRVEKKKMVGAIFYFAQNFNPAQSTIRFEELSSLMVAFQGKVFDAIYKITVTPTTQTIERL
jgi:hypothetical protein